ncbi:tetratricopeptide repeat protein [Magnetococcus sp. PR-3]|uniref:tetratricopeptide repeat protein n=1 Tax=Magnetococcus sp. PR-3 TaxID=3120355 RepID=UPI002FCE3F01
MDNKHAGSTVPLTKKSAESKLHSTLQKIVEYLTQDALSEAEHVLNSVTADHIEHPDVLHLNGMLALKSQQPGKAVTWIEKALKHSPDEVLFHSNLAAANNQIQNWPKAIAAAQKALDLDSHHADAHYAMGLALHRQGQLTAAAASYRQGLLRKPARPSSLADLAADLMESNQLEEAIFFLQQVLTQQPDHLSAQINLAVAWQKKGQPSQACALLEQANQHHPNHQTIISNLSVLLLLQERFAEAAALLLQALLQNPNRVEWHFTLGLSLHRQGNMTDAITHYEHCIRLYPDHALAHYNRGLCQLTLGRLKEGFQGYEWRFQAGKVTPPKLQGELWSGKPDTQKVLLVYAEQGLGDTLQFVRFLPELQPLFKQVALVAPECLFPLFQRMQGIELIPQDHCAQYPCDVHTSLMSLPSRIPTLLEDFGNPPPYLSIPQQYVSSAIKSVQDSKGWKIGLVWRGSRHHEHDKKRSLKLQDLSPLFEITTLDFFSFQMDAQAWEWNSIKSGWRIKPMPLDDTDMARMAAGVMQMDLVITVDTAIAHLAGALGKPVWILLHTPPEWRWQQQLENSPWYPSARLFRQQQEGSWSEVIEEVSTTLTALRHNQISLNDFSAQHTTYVDTTPSDPVRVLQRKGEQAFAHKQWHEALNYYQQIHQYQPDHTQHIEMLATLCLKLKQFSQGLQYIQHGLSRDQTQEQLHHIQGIILAEQGNLRQALASFERALDIAPHFAEVHHNRGHALRRLKHTDAALQAYHSAATLDPESYTCLLHIGHLQMQRKQHEKAIAAYQGVLAFVPDHYTAHLNLALALKACKRYELAIHHAKTSCRLRPDQASPYINLGAIYNAQGRTEDAIQIYQKALYTDGGSAMAHVNLASTYLDQGNNQKAMQLLERATALDPNYAEAYLHRSFEHFRTRRWRNAFLDYEWRWQTNRLSQRRLGKPVWDGRAAPNQTLYVWVEQGMGDTFQFLRYLPLIRTMVGRIILSCQKPMVGLLRQMKALDTVIAIDEKPPAFDQHISLLSVPSRLLGLVDTPPTTIPYLAPSTERVRYWAQRLAAIDGFRIAVAWQGNPAFPNNENRSFPAAQLLPVANLPNVHLIAIQVGDEALAQLEHLPPNVPIIGLEPGLQDFADTAAVMMNVDLIITVDTALAHLAGALGRPLWLAVHDTADWRWVDGAEDNPWYPTLRIFKQSKPKVWQTVFLEIRRALLAHLKHAAPLLSSKPLELESNPTALDSMEDFIPRFLEAIQQLERFPDAEIEPMFTELCTYAPHYPPLLHLEGFSAWRQGVHDLAFEKLSLAVTLAPWCATYVSHRGLLAHELARAAQAEADLKQAIKLEPEEAEHHFNLGNFYKQNNQLDHAQQALNRALKKQPTHYKSIVNLGNILLQQNLAQEAVAHYSKAISLQPDTPSAHFNLSRAQLIQGHWQKGFAAYEWRWRMPNIGVRQLPWPHWDGTPDPDGHLYLHSEQGFGDLIHFIRFLPLVTRYFRLVSISVPVEILPLFATLPLQINWLEKDHTPEQATCFCSLLSLPFVLGLSDAQVEASWQGPYLSPPLSYSENKDLQGEQSLKKVGLCWRGKSTHSNDEKRSMPWDKLEPLFDQAGWQFHDLQWDAPNLAKPDEPGRHDRLIGHLPWTDFLQLAQAIDSLDLVISVDTATAHLAAAMGKPVWLLLAHHPDWRWALDHKTTHWYPTMRLFRQPQPGAWDSVIEAITDTLTTLGSDTL